MGEEGMRNMETVHAERYASIPQYNSSEELLRTFDSYKRLQNENYQRPPSNYEENRNKYYDDLKQTKRYKQYVYISGENLQDINIDEDDDSYVERSIKEATNGKADNVLDFCQYINDTLDKRIANEKAMHGKILKVKGKGYFTELDYNQDYSMLTPIERGKIRDGLLISNKVRNRKFYEDLFAEVNAIPFDPGKYNFEPDYTKKGDKNE